MARHADPARARRGTGHRPQRTAEVVPLPSQPPAIPAWTRPPADLPAGAAPYWEAVVAELLPRRLAPSQKEGERMLVTAALRYRQASAIVEEHGVLVRGQRGPMPNPALRIERDAATAFLRLAESYGLTPAAQMRLGLLALAGESLLASLNDDLDRRARIEVKV